MSTIKTVTILGATGELGIEVLKSLVSAQCFNITILQRSSSKSTLPAGIDVSSTSIPDTLPLEDLTKAFHNQDAVIVCLRVKDLDQHNRIALAAAQAGVKRFIPADFGSCDPTSSLVQSYVPLFKLKADARDYLESIVKGGEYPDFSWTGLVNGHFFDWGLRHGFCHFYLDERRVDILDGGDVKASYSTLGRVGEATVRVLQRLEESRNKALFVQSFCVSQREILESIEKAAGGRKWKVDEHDSKTFLEEHKKKADAGDKEAVEDLVFALGTIDANWEKKDGFAMKLLGLEDEDLDQVVGKIVNEGKTSN